MNEPNRQYQLSEPSDEVVFFPTGENGVFGLLGYCSISSKPVDRMALRDKVEDIMDLLGLPASPGYAAAR